jgi:hypothetical protein
MTSKDSSFYHDMGACTMDIWTDRYARRSFLGITYHFIDSNFQLQNILLDASFFQHPHTAEEISTRVNEVIEDFGVADLVQVELYCNSHM